METPEVISRPKPKTKETKPKTKEAKPKTKETKPKTKEIQPNTNETQPKTKDTKLKTITTKTLLASLSDVKVESTTHPSAFKYIQNFNKVPSIYYVITFEGETSKMSKNLPIKSKNMFNVLT